MYPYLFCILVSSFCLVNSCHTILFQYQKVDFELLVAKFPNVSFPILFQESDLKTTSFNKQKSLSSKEIAFLQDSTILPLMNSMEKNGTICFYPIGKMDFGEDYIALISCQQTTLKDKVKQAYTLHFHQKDGKFIQHLLLSSYEKTATKEIFIESFSDGLTTGKWATWKLKRYRKEYTITPQRKLSLVQTRYEVFKPQQLQMATPCSISPWKTLPLDNQERYAHLKAIGFKTPSQLDQFIVNLQAAVKEQNRTKVAQLCQLPNGTLNIKVTANDVIQNPITSFKQLEENFDKLFNIKEMQSFLFQDVRDMEFLERRPVIHFSRPIYLELDRVGQEDFYTIILLPSEKTAKHLPVYPIYQTQKSYHFSNPTYKDTFYLQLLQNNLGDRQGLENKHRFLIINYQGDTLYKHFPITFTPTDYTKPIPKKAWQQMADTFLAKARFSKDTLEKFTYSEDVAKKKQRFLWHDTLTQTIAVDFVH